MRTLSASLAPGSMMAVGWICATGRASAVHDHRGEGRLGDELIIDLGFALELPDIAAMLLLCDMDADHVAGDDRTAETRVIDAHEIDELAFGARAKRMHHQHGRRLRHRLDDEDARHHRALREVALEEGLVDRYVL